MIPDINEVSEKGMEEKYILGDILSYAQSNPNEALVLTCLYGPGKQNIVGRRLNIKDIHKLTKMPPTTIHDILNKLKNKKMIKMEKFGKWNTYTPTSAGMAATKAYITFLKDYKEFYEELYPSERDRERDIALASR